MIMKTYIATISLILISAVSFAQSTALRLNNAVQLLLKDEQMKHASMSLYVVETKTGKVVYHLNEQTGLAAASTQKLFTSIAAFDLLGKDYRFKTELGYYGEIENDSLSGALFVRGHGDPSFGSWRYNATKPESILEKFTSAITSAGIKKIYNKFYVASEAFENQSIPDGWIWEDIGNYYGAGFWPLNWKENQYDLVLKSGDKIGGSVEIISLNGEKSNGANFNNQLTAAAKGTGDNAYIYLPDEDNERLIKGTIPVNENNFEISGATTDPIYDFIGDFCTFLEQKKILNKPDAWQYTLVKRMADTGKIIYTHYSPSLDSINYWFLQKSINLYGEALLKTMAYEKAGYGSTAKGIEILKDFWSKSGIEKSALNIVDGSGLSPQNRVTTDALVKALQYAKTRDWYGSFYNALPLYNGMKMKSGTIGGAKAYAGYHTSKSGMEYTFAIIINNYDQEAGSIVPKMFRVLNELK